MRKRRNTVFKLAAIASSLLACGAVQAQNSITLYGIVDDGLLYANKAVGTTPGQSAGRQFSMISGALAPSLFGLTGKEDLGGGLDVSFKLQSGISVANGSLSGCNGNLFGCEAWIALGDSQYGTVKAGLQFSPFYIAVYESDPRNGSVFGSGLVNMVDNVAGTGVFNSNALSYTSPTIAGLQASVMYALGGTAGDFQAGRQYSASLMYELGGFMMNASIYDGNPGGSAAQTPVPTTLEYEGRTIGAAYKIGPLTAKLSFVNYKVAGSFNNNVYGCGFDYHVTPMLDVNGGVWVTSDRNHTANRSVIEALGAEYDVSKRTLLYAQVGAVDNHGAMDTGLAINGAMYEPEGTTIATVVGIRHTF